MFEQERNLMRQGSQILAVKTYLKFRGELNPEYKVICDGVLNTGARVVEFWEIVKHPAWFHASRRLIDLPKEGAAKKPQMEQTDRTILLSSKGVEVMEAAYTFGITSKDRASFGQAMTRAAIKAGLNPKGINPKSLRKDCASWLLEVRKDYNIDALDIARSLGHDIKTLVKHYDGNGFTKDEHRDMQDYFAGWGVR
jgi:integrase